MTTQIRGHDWTELAPVFGVAPFDDGAEGDDARLLENLHRGIADLLIAFHKAEPCLDERQQEQVAQLRAFVATLAIEAEHHHFDAPLWRGLAGIFDDYTFLQHAHTLLESMWT